MILILSCSDSRNQAIVVINNYPISIDIFKKRYSDFLTSTMQSDNLLNRYVFLNSIIDEKLFLKYAKDVNIDSDENLLIKKEKIFNQLLLNTYYDFQVSREYKISEKDLRQLFSWQNTKCHIKHLYSPTQTGILEIQSKLERGMGWDYLAKECFQDSVLKNNGGNIGWVKLGDIEPTFEFIAFGLKDGEISGPVKTRSGYSIIQRIESIYEGFLKEKKYQNEKNDLIALANKYKEHFNLLDYTNGIMRSLNISFNHDILIDIYEMLFSPNFDGEIPSNKILVSFKGGSWNVDITLQKIIEISERQLNRIRSVDDLKQAISGLICRSYFFTDARKKEIHNTDKFVEKYNSLEKQETVRYVLEIVKRGVDPKDPEYDRKIRKKYSNFRTELLNQNIVSVDSSIVKNFIL
tara:strand:+ start:4389 stop:5609 length:1221 start_codon:yes stop_codon:yes gene_type:complete